MTRWVAICVLPGVSLSRNLDGASMRLDVGPLSLVTADEARARLISAFSPALEHFLHSFRDEFGKWVEPSVLLCKAADHTTGGTREAVAAFRHVIGMSVIPLARARRIGQRSMPGGILWAESVAIHPWMVGSDGDSLVALTPAQTAFGNVDEFAGSLVPGLRQTRLTESDIDIPLLCALSRAWRGHFSEGKRTAESRALFRSIAAAQEALRLPGGSDVTAEDVGRLSLAWVSAFETLIWPIKNRAGIDEVTKVIYEIEWFSSRLQKKCRSVISHRKSHPVSHPVWIYNNLYVLRNDYAHGNEIVAEKHASQALILAAAAVLYRCVLAHQLCIWRGKEVRTTDAPFERAGLAAFFCRSVERWNTGSFSRIFEQGLLWYRGRSVVMRRHRQRPPHDAGSEQR